MLSLTDCARVSSSNVKFMFKVSAFNECDECAKLDLDKFEIKNHKLFIETNENSERLRISCYYFYYFLKNKIVRNCWDISDK